MTGPLTPPDPLEAPTCPDCLVEMEAGHTSWSCPDCGFIIDFDPEPEYDSYND